MNYTMSSSPYALPQYAAILVSGPDAASYLQGQLSLDLDTLTPARMELASVNSAQGRVQAVVWLLSRPEGIVLIVSSQLVEATIARLRKYTLRAKVRIEPLAGTLEIRGSDDAFDAEPQTHHYQDGISRVRWPGSATRTLWLLPASQVQASDAEGAVRWHLADIRAGLPQVYSATHEAFVAQMLNLDLLGGVSFEKGCYTGQEIIARTHFRGTVKRRMLRFKGGTDVPVPGARVTSAGAHAGDVVDAIQTPEGCELLAVVNLAQRDSELTIGETRLEPLALPYEIS